MRFGIRFWTWLALMGCSLFGEARAATWQKITNEDVVLYSDAPPRDMVEFAVGYTAFRQALRTAFALPRLPPVTVLLFRRAETLREYLPPSKDKRSALVSLTTEVDEAALLAMALSGDREQTLETTYEFETMWSLRRAGYFLPLWVSQGAGEVFSSLTLRKGQCIIGLGPPRMWVFWGQADRIPWPRIFEIHSDSPEYREGKGGSAFHAQAWALMHFILLEGDEGRSRFTALTSLLSNVSGLEAAEAVLHEPAANFDRLIRPHLERHAAWAMPFDEVAVRTQLKVVAAPEAEVEVQLANLLVSGGRFAEADQRLERARSLAPDAPWLKEALARQAFRHDRPEDAARIYREAITAGSIDPVAYMVSANQRMDDGSAFGRDRAGDGGPQTTIAVAELRKAIALSPGSVEAYRLLGRAFFLLPTITRDEIAELSRGAAPGAEGASVRYARALLYARLDLRREYLAELRQLKQATTTSRVVRRLVEERLEAEDFEEARKQVDALMKQRRYSEARAVIAGARGEGVGRAVADQYEQLTDWLDEKQAIERLNELCEARQWREVSAAAKSFVEKFPRSRMLADVKRLGEEARRASEK